MTLILTQYPFRASEKKNLKDLMMILIQVISNLPEIYCTRIERTSSS